MNFRDVELLTEYLDGRLNASAAARLEARLRSDASLKAELDSLRETRGVLRRLPQRRSPRNFRLTPQMAGVRPPEPRAYPVFRLATALAAFLFVASMALNAVVPVAAPRLAAAPAPAYGIGGGGGGGADPTMEAQLLATAEAPVNPLAESLPAPTATLTEDAARTLAAPTQEANLAAPPQAKSGLQAVQPPIPVGWVVALGVLMVLCAAAAWLLRQNSERRIRSQWNRK